MVRLLQKVKAKIYHFLYGPKRYRYLFEAILTLRARRIMEIGTWNGRRAEKMIVAAKQHRAASEIEYYGFDLFEQMTPEINRENYPRRRLPKQKLPRACKRLEHMS